MKLVMLSLLITLNAEGSYKAKASFALGPQETEGKSKAPDMSRFELLGYLVKTYNFPDYDVVDSEISKECNSDRWYMWHPSNILNEKWADAPIYSPSFKKKYYWHEAGKDVILYRCMVTKN